MTRSRPDGTLEAGELCQVQEVMLMKTVPPRAVMRW
jgi:hypothetical protein